MLRFKPIRGVLGASELLNNLTSGASSGLTTAGNASFAYGGTMPIYSVLIRHYFGQRIMGTILGAAAMVSSLGMALGPAVGGWIFDTYRSYTALYLGSLVAGFVAVALALALPRVGRTAPTAA